MGKITKAFILGAGLGTRLRPLTDSLPKPLVPVCNRPLITYAFDHLIADLGVEEFAVNTHHCPEAYVRHFPEGRYCERRLLFRHEPVLLETAGGIDNLRDWIPREESIIVYNGDILADMPLHRALEQHLRSGDAVTMVLRSRGEQLQVGFEKSTGKVIDIRSAIGADCPHRFQFTGIYLISPQFLPYLKPGKIESVVLPILDAIRDGGRVGGIVVDEGEWSDLGDRDAYLDALSLPWGDFPRYGGEGGLRISPGSTIAPDACIDTLSTVGARARIGSGAVVRESVIWPDAVVAAGAVLQRVVVRDGCVASGTLSDVDL